MAEMNLRAMLTAPKDGTFVILVDSDLGGFYPARWHSDEKNSGFWQGADDEVCEPFAGWLEMPPDLAAALATRWNE